MQQPQKGMAAIMTGTEEDVWPPTKITTLAALVPRAMHTPAAAAGGRMNTSWLVVAATETAAVTGGAAQVATIAKAGETAAMNANAPDRMVRQVTRGDAAPARLLHPLHERRVQLPLQLPLRCGHRREGCPYQTAAPAW